MKYSTLLLFLFASFLNLASTGDSSSYDGLLSNLVTIQQEDHDSKEKIDAYEEVGEEEEVSEKDSTDTVSSLFHSTSSNIIAEVNSFKKENFTTREGVYLVSQQNLYLIYEDIRV
ncbi:MULTISPECIES: hypothetical protein [Nonlabens]|uniref:Uncharacterized protein n=1 Tax=Nonlabens xylanidelens TaxID=191564 RepID=A0A2S6ILE5_9FLAO|nr:hypothetical protein [Nonlabens xylanidelens]PPK95054.1 hypothetical protein LY01_01807 [Nonlabens xylanidelens]PQJ17588.1 hypothetical protein BST94_11090 [Nonlabens xylanidelens]